MPFSIVFGVLLQTTCLRLSSLALKAIYIFSRKLLVCWLFWGNHKEFLVFVLVWQGLALTRQNQSVDVQIYFHPLSRGESRRGSLDGGAHTLVGGGAQWFWVYLLSQCFKRSRGHVSMFMFMSVHVYRGRIEEHWLLRLRPSRQLRRRVDVLDKKLSPATPFVRNILRRIVYATQLNNPPWFVKVTVRNTMMLGADEMKSHVK